MKFKTNNDFCMHIEQTAINEGVTCYSVLLQYCEDEDIEVDDIARWVNPQLKGKLEAEFMELGLLRKRASIEE